MIELGLSNEESIVIIFEDSTDFPKDESKISLNNSHMASRQEFHTRINDIDEVKLTLFRNLGCEIKLIV